jgi:hypothetical protein
MHSSYTFPDSPGKEALGRVGRELLGMENISLAVPETAAGIEGVTK